MIGTAGDLYPERELSPEGQNPKGIPQRPRIEPNVNGGKSQ